VQIGRIYTPECDADLGDTRCKVVMTPYTKTGTVGAVTSNKVFVIAGTAAGQAANYYDYGKITFSGGANAGITMQIESYVNTTNLVTLYEPMPFTVATSDAFTAYAGCGIVAESDPVAELEETELKFKPIREALA
jgi:uncharacterized phage protein (TIGR02218 family)